MPPTRRLAAIFVADVVGYSRLMRADEEGTHKRVRAHCRELVDPKISEHHGRIVKNTGDGMLAEFPSVVEAVLCAIAVQCGMCWRNLDVPDDERISFRIGVNLGDVIAEPEDIYGDGVNIAARLEALAEPNGICISHTVYDQVRDKLPYPFEDLGHQHVKNITRPLHAFALRPEVIATLPASQPAVPAEQPISALSLPGTARVPRLSIIVLPFSNLSNDSEQQYLADAITDDVTTDLSRLPDMIVISRNTAFTYRDRSVETRQIGRDLHVRYVLQGSVRRSGNRVRVNAQLIDVETDTHIWADRFDYATDDLFALQDEVTSRIAIALNLELPSIEATRPAGDPDAVDLMLRGRAALYNPKGATREGVTAAIQLFERALVLAPSAAQAQALLALALLARVFEQMTDTRAADIRRAEKLVLEALAESPRHPLVRYAVGQVLRAQNRFEAAIPEYEAAIALDHNAVLALAALGQCRFFTGALGEVIPAQERAIRLSPRDPYIANWYWRIGMVHLLQSRTDEAISWIERARSANPQFAGPHAWLASAYALSGDRERAAAELADARRLSRDSRYASITLLKAAQSYGKAQHLAETTFLAGLRQAGVPEE